MTTAIIIIAVLLALAAAAFFVVRGRGATGGRGLRGRFGPEYDRVVARHGGDTKAAEHELGERVRLHGSLERRPLADEARAQYAARWAGAQERFVESPEQALAEADALLAALSRDRGFPDGENFEERTDALSVHHGAQVNGYRRVHRALSGGSGTEEMREAFVEARGLFDALLGDGPAHREHGNGHLVKGRGTS
ncbi:hypothetical protein EES43_01175 [Streptomyces sp. ADI96-02]|uniref:hypothetical protein n=1 Tax=unclassified Streptomyces TaxID=2593676 RepID=UPI000F5564C6|nr:hypothetical protein [Streptomyces sp. ADI96-02]RPK68804.1 hypothetical protein EES43_01175 [Streptomyces sp. ADI96-02]